jgi:hypothetical protein
MAHIALAPHLALRVGSEESVCYAGRTRLAGSFPPHKLSRYLSSNPLLVLQGLALRLRRSRLGPLQTVVNGKKERRTRDAEEWIENGVRKLLTTGSRQA